MWECDCIFFSILTSKYHDLSDERDRKGYAGVTSSMACILQGGDQVLMKEPHTKLQGG